MTLYKYTYESDLTTLRILSAANVVLSAITFATYLYAGLFRWYQVFAIRQKSYLVRFDRMTIGEKRLALNIVPIAVITIFRIVLYNVYASRKNIGYWENQTEFSLMMDLCAQYFILALVASKL